MRISKKAVLLFVSGIVLAMCAAGVWMLKGIPFGTLFDTALHAGIVSLVLVLASLARFGLGSKRWWWKSLGSLSTLVALIIIVMIVILHTDYKLIPGLAYNEGLSAEEWKEDLRYFGKEFPEKHPMLFEMVDKDKYDAFVSDFEKKIPGLDEQAIKMEFYRLLALPKDAHSFPNIFTHKLDWHSFPLQGYLFDTGYYILDAGRDHKNVVGTYLISIDSMPIEEIYERIRPYLSSESENNWKDRFTQVVTVAEWLYAGGVIKEKDRATFRFRAIDGEAFDVEMKAIHYMPAFAWSFLAKIDVDLSWIHVPDREDNYWFTLLEDSRTLYIQFNGCLMEDFDETLEQFIERLAKFEEEMAFDRCVIDIRKNGGGNPNVSRMLGYHIIGNPRIDREGRLFVLTSRKTFSAAVEFASLLENNSRAILIGEPTGQGPVFCGGPSPVTLPNSGIELLVAGHKVFTTLIDDGLDGVIPSILTDYTVDDYLSGRDPALEAALDYEIPERPAVSVSVERIGEITGRYAFSPYQLLTVSEEDGSIRFDVTDFYEGSFMSAGSKLYALDDNNFKTDIRGVTLEFPVSQTGELIVHWRGVDKKVPRADGVRVYPMEMLANARYGEAAVAFIAEAELYRERFAVLQRILNSKGYELMRVDDLENAITVLRLNVDLFPESSNVYDSLGEAYMKNGDKDLAIENYEKSLELNPENANAEKMLAQLK